MHLPFISAGLLPLSLSFSPSRVMLRPSLVPKSSTTALMRASVPGFILTFASSVPPAKLSFRTPHSPLGSAAVTATLAAITLSKRTFHSSGVKLDLSATDVSSSGRVIEVTLPSPCRRLSAALLGRQHLKLGFEGVDRRLQHLGNTRDRQHLVKQLV